MKNSRPNTLSNFNNKIASENTEQELPGLSEIYSKNVFSKKLMQQYLSEDCFYSLQAAINNRTEIDKITMDEVADGVKRWALDNGASHYTHWFQPLTGLSAEKHDAFLTPTENGKCIEQLKGKELLQREPDGSSFPSGGLRKTHEARAYTIWDPTSPMFIMEVEWGKTLYIPSVFVSYTGESLDYKAPLLKSSDFLNKTATEVCQYFDKNVKKVNAFLGWEQEYFLVSEEMFNARPDLVGTGRTLFGKSSNKDQQLDDHYFGSIPEKFQNFMMELERESLKVGIPLLTRHNEVAPHQFEFAPMYAELNVAVDQNMLLMDLMNRLALKHNCRVLLHEKPFAGINGSGKHNNWSIGTDTGVNLLDPGSNPSNDLQFLTFFTNVIQAVNKNEALLRASVASVGNDHRMGANEAPPAIISVFTGDLLKGVLDKFKAKGLMDTSATNGLHMQLDIPNIPKTEADNTDRNRTSPFPFTGNKFEFRAVGSTANCSGPMTVLNTIVADQLKKFKAEVDQEINDGKNTEEAIVNVLQEYLNDCERIIFNGDNYSKEWEEEAEKRGLTNIKKTSQALSAFINNTAKKVFIDNNIFTEAELEARHEVFLENYINKMDIEYGFVDELSQTHIIPAAEQYLNVLGQNFKTLKDMGLEGNAENTKKNVQIISGHIAAIRGNVEAMKDEREKAHNLKTSSEVATAFSDQIKPYFETIRTHADALEILVDDNFWRLPKYRELLFLR